MTALKKLTNNSLFPNLASDIWNPTNFFSPRFFDIEGDYLNFGLRETIPSLNIIENTEDFKIEMAAPGLRKKDFKVELNGDILTISAEKEKEEKEEKQNFSRREFSYNSFSRSVRLPENCQPDKINAKYEDGVLCFSLPKKEIAPVKPAKEIKIS